MTCQSQKYIIDTIYHERDRPARLQLKLLYLQSLPKLIESAELTPLLQLRCSSSVWPIRGLVAALARSNTYDLSKYYQNASSRLHSRYGNGTYLSTYFTTTLLTPDDATPLTTRSLLWTFS